MLSDQELARYVESFVRQVAALPGGAAAGISPEAVVRELEKRLGVDLAPRAPLIRGILVALLCPPATAPASRGDHFDPASSPHGQQPHFATTTTASPAHTGLPHFFSQQQPTPQQLQSYYAASQQYQQQHHQQQHRASPPAASQQYQQQQQQQNQHRASPPDAQQYQQQQQQRASPPAASPYDTPGSFRYAQPGGAQLQRLVQMQQYHQQQQMAAAVSAAAANAATAGQSPRGPVAESPRGAASARPKKER
jgi:hypothetical protein